MGGPRDEEGQLRQVTLQNAQSVLRVRMRAEEALRSQSDWLRVTLDSVGDAVISVDADGRVSLMNGVAERLTGWEQADALGHPLSEIVRIVDAHVQQRVVEAAALRGDADLELPDETLLVARDGTTRPVAGRLAPIRSTAGETVGAVLVVRDTSERQSAQRQLRRTAEANAKFRALFEQEAQFAGILSLDGVVLEANRSWLDSCGFVRADVIGKPFWECGWWNRDPEVIQLIMSACAKAAQGELFRTETRYFLVDRTSRYVDLTIAPVTDEDGRVLFVSLTGTDITDRRAVEHSLEESRRRLASANAELRRRVDDMQALLDVLPVGVFVAEDPGCTTITGNATGRAMLAVSLPGNVSKTASDGVRLPFRVLKDGVEVPGEELPMQRAARLGVTVREEELDVERADGSIITLLEYAAPLFDAAKNVRGSIGAFVDITQRNRDERALREVQIAANRQRRLYEAILNNTPDLAYVCDLQHRLIYLNEGLLKLLGRTWDDAVGRHFLELGYEPWLAQVHSREIDEVVATRAPIRAEVPFHGTLGRRIHDYIFVPVFGAEGEVEAVAGTARDVTDQKRADTEREALLALERSARADAERASTIKEEFLAMLSHELRTPLNAIVGWTHILRTTPPSEEIWALGLSVIDRNARVQTQLIADLLDMSRIVSGNMRLEMERIEWPVVINAVLDAVRPAAESKAIRIDSDICADTDVVSGDPLRLQQVVWNLLSNAVKFTPRGGHVRLAVGRVDAHVEVVVSDTGQGIRSEFLQHVFDRFRQANNSAAREYGGLGLGLAIVKQLAELHGGSVDVESVGEGAGATFTVRLPVSAVALTSMALFQAERVAEPASADQPALPDLRGVTVLVVDDEQDALDIIQHVLEARGAHVVTAVSADLALSVMQRVRPDVVLSDIGMPGRDGYSLMSEMRNRGLMVPAAALTAFAGSQDRTRAFRAGFQTHVAKPVRPAELVATVAALAYRTGSSGDHPIQE